MVPILRASREMRALILRGELYRAQLDPVLGSEQGGTRPVLIVQNNVGNKYSPTVIAVAVTSRMGKARLPTHIELPAQGTGLKCESLALAEQIRTLDKQRLCGRMGQVSGDVMRKVDEALRLSLCLADTGDNK